MSLAYQIMYALGFTPWDLGVLARLPARLSAICYDRVVRPATLLLMVVHLGAGCHRLIPFHTDQGAGRDHRVLDAPSDGAGADARWDWRRDAPADLAPDAPGFDLKKDALKPDAPPCTESQEAKIVATCNQQCASTTADADCDGLPDTGRDPQVGCNKLYFADGFTTFDKNVWTATGTSWSCGKLAMAAGSSISTLSDLTVPTSKQLIEIKLTLQGTAAGDWSVGVKTNVGADAWTTCEVWQSAQYAPSSSGPHLNTHPVCAESGTWDPNAIAMPAGTTLYLQVYNDGTYQRCRVLSAAGVQINTTKSLACAPSKAGKLTIYASGRDAAVDHVRAFGYN